MSKSEFNTPVKLTMDTIMILPSDHINAKIPEDDHWSWSLYLETIVFVIIVLLTIVGNSAVIFAVATRKTLRSPTHLFIANLAVADLLVGILVLPFLATLHITEQWYFGQTYCTTWMCIHFWLCSASILSICAICLDRYIGVRYALHHQRLMTMKNVAIIVAVVWILAGCLSVIPIFIWPEPTSGDELVCKTNEQLGHVLVVSIGIFYIPVLFILVLYWRIYRTVVNHLKSIEQGYAKHDGMSHQMRIHIGGRKSDTTSQSEMSVEISNSFSSQNNLLATNQHRQSNTAKKMVLVVGALLLCYFPFFTMFLIRSLHHGAISDPVYSAFGWIRYFNSCLNPMIYAVMLSPFRKAFQQILCCKK